MNEESNIKEFFEKYQEGYLSESAYNNLLKIHYPSNKKFLEEKPREKNEYNKKISIIIPTYNRVKQLTQCINSILKQSYKNFEIIIIDDCSTDSTKDVYSNHEDKRIRYFINEKNLGMGLNRQKGYNLSKGDYIIFCDDDDYFIDNDYFSEAINIFEDDTINIICSNSYIHYENENIFEFHNLNMNKKMKSIDYLKEFQIKLKKPTSTFAAIFRKINLDAANFKNMKMMNDTSIYLRALMMGNEIFTHKKIIGIYRIHGKNYTVNVKADFTLKNIEEKKYIYEYIKEKNLIDNVKKWYEEQVGVTVRYFLNGNNKNKEDIDNVLNWVKNNVSYKEYIKFRIRENNFYKRKK